MKTIIGLSIAAASLVSTIGSYFLFRPGPMRVADWERAKSRTESAADKIRGKRRIIRPDETPAVHVPADARIFTEHMANA